MDYLINVNHLNKMLTDAAELGARRIAKELGISKPFMSQNEAWKIYGRRTIERWIEEGLITPQKDGNATSKIRLDRMELETLSKSSNRHTYLTVAERSKSWSSLN